MPDSNLNIEKKEFKTLNVSEVQPRCFSGENPDEKIIKNMGKDVGNIAVESTPEEKYLRAAGYGEKPVRNDDFISIGLCPEAF